MKNALILLGVVAVVVLTLGFFNREISFDVDYAVGVRRSVNAFWLFAIAAGVIVVAGLLGASLARASGWRERGKLQKELLDVYRRLRAAEAKLEEAAGAAGVAAAVIEARTMAAATDAPDTTTRAAEPVEAEPRPGEPAESETQVGEPVEAATAVIESVESETQVTESADASGEQRPPGEGEGEAGA